MKTDPNAIPGTVRKTQQTFEFLIQDVLRGSWFTRLVFVVLVFTIVANPSLIKSTFSISGLPLWYKVVYYFTGGILVLTTLIVGLKTLPRRPSLPPDCKSAPADLRSEPAIVASLPEFTMIRLKRECESWKEIGDGKFGRNFDYEFAEDPVFEIVVENNSTNILMFHRAGIRLLRRDPTVGGTLGSWDHRTLEVQAELIVHCPDEWKRTEGVIDDRNSMASKPFVKPIELNKGGCRYLFTLKLENFVDTNSASDSEVRFYIVTGNNRTAESRSILLCQ